MKIARDKLRLALSRLQDRKDAAIRRFQDLGVRSKADAAQKPECRVHLREIQRITAEMRPLQRRLDAYEMATNRLEAKLREMDRQTLLRGTVAGDEDLYELSATLHDLDEQLELGGDPAQDAALESVMQDELGWHE